MKKETNIILQIVRELLLGILKLVLHLVKVVYLIVRGFDTMVGKLFNKLPRLAKVVTIYLLIAMSTMAVLMLTNKINF